MTATLVPRLTPVTQQEHETIKNAPKTTAQHRFLMQEVAAMQELEHHGKAQALALPPLIKVAAWNVERCLFVEETAEKLRDLCADIVLLSEVDCGMSRTGQRHTAKDMAGILGMEYLYGVEFYEMELGGPVEVQKFCKDDFNALGWHGNALLSSIPIERAALIRLDDHGHWFCPSAKAQTTEPRLGGRMAIAAVIGGVCYVSTHLESAADAKHRDQQIRVLLKALGEFAPGTPTLIGGDMNTGNHLPPHYNWRDDILFDTMSAHGFDWSFHPKGPTTRPSLITKNPSRAMKLDWFFAKDLAVESCHIEPALDPNAKPLSDHECLMAYIRK